MLTTPLPNTASGTQLPSTVKKPSKLSLNPQDFIQMMITQLQNQDPLQPQDNGQLLAQMAQIGQMQSATDLQTSLQGMVQQNQIGAASSLIGKTVQGMDTNNNTIGGMVTSVKVAQNSVSLELDNGKSLDLGRVTNISPGPTASSPVTQA